MALQTADHREALAVSLKAQVHILSLLCWASVKGWVPVSTGTVNPLDLLPVLGEPVS